MNTEKIEKLKKSLSNSKIPADLKPKIEAEIKRLEDLDAKQSAPKEEAKEEEKPVAKTRKPRAKKPVAKRTSTRKPSETSKPKSTPMSLAKEIRKEGESWSDARARASKMMKEKTHTATKDVESELDKLTKLVRSKKELRGQVGHTNLLRDAKRKAKPMGRRVSKDGNVYYENRANRTDKGTFGKYHLAKGGGVGEKLKSGVYRVGKPTRVSANLYEQKIVEIFDNGDISTASDYGRKLGDFKSQKHPIITKEELEAQYKMTDGGGIPNNYEGKTPEEVWNNLSKQQRGHFLYDHVSEIEEYKNIEKLPSSEIIKAYNSEWSSLDKDIKNRFTNHTREGQYADGGGVGNDRYDGKTEEIVSELKNLKGGLYDKAPRVYQRNGLIYVSAENGDNYADYDEYLFIDEQLEELADKYDTYWDWENAGAIVLTPLSDEDEYADGGEISSKQLDLGYQYSFNKDEDNVGSLYKEAGVYSVIGFENGKHFSESFEKFSDAKKFYLDKKGKVKFELGGTIVTDLAGHTGGSLGGDPTMLDGFSGTSYTGLVGETGAMSSGEMFMAGGTLPEGVSQSYMITESLGNPAQHFAKGGGINEKTNKMRKQKLKKGDDVLIIGRRWFDRVNGNTYHTAEVQVNGEFVGKSTMTYGYDEQYLETGKEILLDHYELPRGMKENAPLWQLREYGVVLHKYAIDGLKRELAKGGGFAEHNGRKYDIGRNWTKDHNEFDKGADYEVEYRRKKSFFSDGGEFMTDPTFGNFQNQVFADGGGVGHTPKRIQERLEYLRGEIRNESISYGEIAELQSMKEYIDPSDVELLEFAGVPEFEDDDNYANGGFMDGVYAKGGKVSPFKNMMETNTITEKEINLIKLRLNNDKVDKDTQEAIDYIWENSPQLTPDQNKKGIDYLRNLWKSPTGKERANNPFGYREQDALETFEYFELRGFYDAGNRYRKFYVPLYTCVGADSSFEYAFYNGEVNILG